MSEHEPVGKVGLPSQGAGPVRIWRPPDGQLDPAPTLRPDMAPPIHNQPPERAMASHVNRATRKCAKCGRDYQPNGNRQKYCSPTCGASPAKAKSVTVAAPAQKAAPAAKPESAPRSTDPHIAERPALYCRQVDDAAGPVFEVRLLLDIAEAAAVLDWLQRRRAEARR